MTLPSQIWQFRGSRPGPRVLVLGGTHGDELTGIRLVQSFLRSILPGRDLLAEGTGVFDLPEIAGDLFLGFGNPAAIAAGERRATDDLKNLDLNRCFLPALLEGDRSWPDLERARELWPFLQTIDFFLDLHSVSAPNADPFVCFGEWTDEHARLCSLIPVRYVVTDPYNQLGIPEGIPQLPTTDSVVNLHGGSDWSVQVHGRRRGVAICYETGSHTDFTKLPLAKVVTCRFLSEVGTIFGTSVADRLLASVDSKDVADVLASFDVADQKRYALVTSVMANHAVVRHAPGMTESWGAIRRGDLYGHYGDGREIRIPEDGVLLFTKPPERVKVGASLFFVARLID